MEGSVLFPLFFRTPFVPRSGQGVLGTFTDFWGYRVFWGEPGAAGDLLPAALPPGLILDEELYDSSCLAPPPTPTPAAGQGLFLAAGEAEERRLGRVLREGRLRRPPRGVLMAGRVA